MKKITFIFLTFLAVFAFAPQASAQCTSINYDASCFTESDSGGNDFLSSNPESNDYNRATAGDTFYVRSNTGNPWGQTTNQTSMDTAFGVGNWTEIFFETLDPIAVFSASTKFVFMEGSDQNASPMNVFLLANLPAIESWVNAGGILFMNAAPNGGGNINFGFGGSLLNYSGTSSTTSSSVTVIDVLHPAFVGPNMPTVSVMTGTSYSHAFVTGTGFTVVLEETGNASKTVLVEKNWGSGHVMMGGMTTTNFHSPNPEATNWRSNLLVYLEAIAIAPITGCATDTPLAISNALPPTISTFNVADSGILGTNYDLNTSSLEITHTWDSDLNIQLQSPMGTTLDLSMGNGGASDNYTGTVFQDGGADINAASAPFTGTFEPEGGTFAAAFAGEDINGNWSLIVTDTAGGDDGTLTAFCMEFTPILGAPPVIACPADISVDNDTGDCGAVVNFTDAVAIDP
ncbi:MAG: proprotein convertase P-domain-containing protein, partial [Flavobacteriaceae bacterium]